MRAKYPYHLLITHQKLRVHKLIQMSHVIVTVGGSPAVKKWAESDIPDNLSPEYIHLFILEADILSFDVLPGFIIKNAG